MVKVFIHIHTICNIYPLLSFYPLGLFLWYNLFHSYTSVVWLKFCWDYVKHQTKYQSISYSHYSLYQYNLYHLGHAPTFVVKKCNKRKFINGIPFFSKVGYQLAQWHFHFGSNSTWGTEHAINGKRYSAEVG